MPVATVNHQYKRYELRSVEGGWVELRQLPYGLKLERRDQAMRMKFEQQVQRKKSRRQNEPEVQKIEVEQHSTWATHFDFSHCIGDHNLTDENNNKLDFSSPMLLKHLDPRVGSEIEDLLGEINGDVDEEELEVFTQPSKLSSSTEPT